MVPPHFCHEHLVVYYSTDILYKRTNMTTTMHAVLVTTKNAD